MYRLKLRYLSTLVVLLCVIYYIIKTNAGALALNEDELLSVSRTEDTSLDHQVAESQGETTTNTSLVGWMESILVTNIYHGITSIAIDREMVGDRYMEDDSYVVSEIPYQPRDTMNYISSISFQTSENIPYVRLTNKEVSIGVGTTGFLIPSNVYEFLPQEIIVIGMYELDGRIILQRKPNVLPPWMNLDLSDIGLSAKDEKKFKYSESRLATLEMVQNYNLVYPNEFKFTDEIEDFKDISIQIPFKFQYTVND